MFSRNPTVDSAQCRLLAILSLSCCLQQRFAFSSCTLDTSNCLPLKMITFCLLVAPLPFGPKKRLFTFLSESTIVAKIAYGLKISFMQVPASIITLFRILKAIQLRRHSLRRRGPTNVPRDRRVRPRQTQQPRNCPRYPNRHWVGGEEILVRYNFSFFSSDSRPRWRY